MPIKTHVLQYSDRLSRFQILYIYNRLGTRGEPVVFSRSPEPGEIAVADAQSLTAAAISLGLEVRITNAADELVLHSAPGGELIWPETPDKFWSKLL